MLRSNTRMAAQSKGTSTVCSDEYQRSHQTPESTEGKALGLQKEWLKIECITYSTVSSES